MLNLFKTESRNAGKNNILRIVKMTAYYSLAGLILQALIVSFLFATPSEGQNLREVKVSVNAVNVSLEQALQIIESKTNFKFIFFEEGLPLKEKASVIVDDESLYNILEVFAKDYGLTFNRINDQIVVKKNQGQTENLITAAETGTIKGKVTDASTKEPLYGASVSLKGTTKGAYTDTKGNFEIDDVKPGKYTVAASYVGFSTSTKTVVVSANQTVDVNLALGQSVVNLDEVTVTGSISERSIRESSNPITIIGPKELVNRNISSLSTVLQTVPGIVFAGVNYNAFGGSESNMGGRLTNRVENFMSIRGYSSGTNPFKIIIDGVELASPYMFNFLDPNQIEKIEIARGPMSSTLYGSGSASGIVQIFTKRGVGNLNVNFKTMLVSQESSYQDANPFNSEYNLSVGANNGNYGYNFAIDYLHTPAGRISTNNGIDGSDWAFNGGVNGTLNSLSADLKIQVTKSRAGTHDGTYWYRTIARVQNWTISPTSPYAGLINTPADVDWDTRVNGFLSSLNMKHVLTNNLFQNLSVGYSNLTNGFNTNNPYPASDGSSYYIISNNYSESINAKYFINWKQLLSDDFKIDFTGGIDVISAKAVSESFPSLTKNDENKSLSINPKGMSGRSNATNETSAIFAEGIWGLYDELFLTTGIRFEKNNSYGDNLGWISMPRVGLTYVTSLGDVTFKPRLSWGKSTQPLSPTYKTESRTVSGTRVFLRLANTDLKPQSQQGYEAGFDLFFSSNYSLSVTYFNQKLVDLIQLIYINDPTVYQKSQYVNISEANNRGVEISARAIYDRFNLDIAYTAITSKYGSGFPVTSTSTDPEYHDGGRVLRVPAGSFSAKLNYNIPSLLPWSQKGGNIALEYIYNGNEYALDILSTLKTALATSVFKYQYNEFPGYSIINLRGNYNVMDNLNLFFDVRNLLNSEELLYNGPVMGRNISFGFNLNLN